MVRRSSRRRGHVAPVHAEVTLHGPLFDGTAQRAIVTATHDIEMAVAEAAAAFVRQRVSSRAKDSSGRFASRTVAERVTADRVRTHTPGLRYGAWLEGTARRNARSTFKGFRPYRDARQEVGAQVAQIAAPLVDRAVKEINR